MAEWVFLYSHLPGPWYLPGPCWPLNLEPLLRAVPGLSRRGRSPLCASLLQAFLHRIRQNVADSVEKGLTEENIKVWTLGLAPLQTVPAAACLAPPRAMLRGCCAGVGGTATLLAAGFVLPQLAPCRPLGPLHPVSLVDVRRTQPQAPRPPVPNSRLSPLAQHDHPVFHAPRARLPGLEPVENPFPSTPGAWHLQLPSWHPSPLPALGTECRGRAVSNWVLASSWPWLWGV